MMSLHTKNKNDDDNIITIMPHEYLQFFSCLSIFVVSNIHSIMSYRLEIAGDHRRKYKCRWQKEMLLKLFYLLVCFLNEMEVYK